MDSASNASTTGSNEIKAVVSSPVGVPPLKRAKVDDTETRDMTVARKADTGWQEEKPSIQDRHAFLVNNELMSDFKFIIGDSETCIFAHKFILATASSCFQKLFYGPEPYSEPDMKIVANYKPSSFLLFLKYLYTNDFESDMSARHALEVGLLARRFTIPGLQTKCAELLMASIDCSTVFWVYGKASTTVTVLNTDISDTCLRFIDGHIEDIVGMDTFLKLDAATLSKILKRDTLRVDETTLFKALLRWSEEQCRRNGNEPTAETKRSLLGDNFRLIRFAAMAPHAFAEDTPHDLFTKDEIIGIYKYLCAKNKKACKVDFPTKIRTFPLSTHRVDRFRECVTAKVESARFPDGKLYESCLRFKCDKLIFVPAIGVHGISSPTPGVTFYVTVKILKESGSLEEGSTPLKSKTVEFRASPRFNLSSPIKILLDTPVGIVPHRFHAVQVTTTISGHGHDSTLSCRQGSHPEKKVTTQCERTPVTINFENDNGSDGCAWQVPMLLFHS